MTPSDVLGNELWMTGLCGQAVQCTVPSTFAAPYVAPFVLNVTARGAVTATPADGGAVDALLTVAVGAGAGAGGAAAPAAAAVVAMEVLVAALLLLSVPVEDIFLSGKGTHYLGHIGDRGGARYRRGDAT